MNFSSTPSGVLFERLDKVGEGSCVKPKDFKKILRVLRVLFPNVLHSFNSYCENLSERPGANVMMPSFSFPKASICIEV